MLNAIDWDLYLLSADDISEFVGIVISFVCMLANDIMHKATLKTFENGAVPH